VPGSRDEPRSGGLEIEEPPLPVKHSLKRGK